MSARAGGCGRCRGLEPMPPRGRLRQRRVGQARPAGLGPDAAGSQSCGAVGLSRCPRCECAAIGHRFERLGHERPHEGSEDLSLGRAPAEIGADECDQNSERLGQISYWRQAQHDFEAVARSRAEDVRHEWGRAEVERSAVQGRSEGLAVRLRIEVLGETVELDAEPVVARVAVAQGNLFEQSVREVLVEALSIEHIVDECVVDVRAELQLLLGVDSS